MNSRWKDRLARDQMSLLASPACGPPLGPTATLELTPEPAQWGRRGPQSRHTVEEGRPPRDASRRVRDPSRQTSRPFPALGPETLRSLPTSRTQPRRQPDGRPHATRRRIDLGFPTCPSSSFVRYLLVFKPARGAFPPPISWLLYVSASKRGSAPAPAHSSHTEGPFRLHFPSIPSKMFSPAVCVTTAHASQRRRQQLSLARDAVAPALCHSPRVASVTARSRLGLEDVLLGPRSVSSVKETCTRPECLGMTPTKL